MSTSTHYCEYVALTKACVVLKQMNGEWLFFVTLLLFIEDNFSQDAKQQANAFICSGVVLLFEMWRQSNFVNSDFSVVSSR